MQGNDMLYTHAANVNDKHEHIHKSHSYGAAKLHDFLLLLTDIAFFPLSLSFIYYDKIALRLI